MNKHTRTTLGIVAIAAIIITLGLTLKHNPSETIIDQGVGVTPQKTDPKNIGYNIDGETIILADGKFTRTQVPDSEVKESFDAFGEPVYGDLDGDGDLDAAMYLTRSGGGSGTFYYVVVAVNEGPLLYRGTNAMFLGDRIAPQNITIEGGNAVANYAERRSDEPFSARPSVGRSTWIHLDPAKREIGELAQHFEGEADPAKMTLSMKKWEWMRTEYTDGTKVVPKKPGAFVLALNADYTFSIKTDCNTMSGKYSAKGSAIMFGEMMSTKMFCEGSQETAFAEMISAAGAFKFTSKGELELTLDRSKGTVYFR